MSIDVTTFLTVPKTYRKSMGALYIRSLIKNLRPSFNSRDEREDMLDGFKKRYTSEYLDQNYLDGAIDWYLSPLYHCEADFSLIPNKKSILALDLGCGAASVGCWLRNNDYEWSYLGVDIVREAKPYFEALSDSKFLCKDIDDLEADDMSKAPDVIFAVNSFCYVSEIEQFISNLHRLSVCDTKLIVIDAHPGGLWRKNSVASRYSTDELCSFLVKNGWKVDKLFKLSVFNIANFPFFIISHTVLCSRVN